jgi:hypothetical protein
VLTNNKLSTENSRQDLAPQTIGFLKSDCTWGQSIFPVYDAQRGIWIEGKFVVGHKVEEHA